MKRIFASGLTLLLVTAFLMPLQAQQRGMRGQKGKKAQMERFRDIPSEQKHQMRMEVLNEYLSLTDDQVLKMNELELDLEAKRQTHREAKVGKAKKRVMQQQMQEYHKAQLHEILTKEQYAIYLEKQEAIRYDIRTKMSAYLETTGDDEQRRRRGRG